MQFVIAAVSARGNGARNSPAAALAADYVQRAARFSPAELLAFASEATLLGAAERTPTRAQAAIVLFDSRGEDRTSVEFAHALQALERDGVRRVLLGIGPADGWSAQALGRARLVLSFGRMTFPHELARVLVAEQLYRALTILAGHPYHLGH